MGPFARAIERLALGQEQFATGLGGGSPGKGRASDELGQAALRQAAERQHAAAWPEDAQQFRPIAGQSALVQQLARHGEIEQVVRVPQLGQGPVMDRHPCAVNAGPPQCCPCTGCLAGIGGHADNSQLSALGQGERQPPFAAAVVDTVALANASGREDRLGGRAAFAHPLILRVRRLDAGDVRARIVEIGFTGCRSKPLGLPVLLDADRVMIRRPGLDAGDNGLVLPCLLRQIDAVLQRRRHAVRQPRGHRLGGFPPDDRLAR